MHGIYKKYIPKHIPHNPVNIVKSTTYVISPRFVKPKMAKLNNNTRIVWNTMTINCVKTCENSNSAPVIPDTRHLSIMPEFFSIIMAPEVKATDKKKIMLQRKKQNLICFYFN